MAELKCLRRTLARYAASRPANRLLGSGVTLVSSTSRPLVSARRKTALRERPVCALNACASLRVSGGILRREIGALIVLPLSLRLCDFSLPFSAFLGGCLCQDISPNGIQHGSPFFW